MDFNEIMQTLEQYQKIEARIKIFKLELDTINVTSYSALGFDVRDEIILRWHKLTKKQKEDTEHLVMLMERKLAMINYAVEILPELQREFIKKKYMQNKKYFEVCLELHISERYARKLKNRAINEIIVILKGGAENVST